MSEATYAFRRDLNAPRPTDNAGRPYAKLSELRPGDFVEVDDGFDCICGGAVKEVQAGDDGELYVDCILGEHSLDGQIDVDGDTLIGVYRTRGLRWRPDANDIATFAVFVAAVVAAIVFFMGL